MSCVFEHPQGTSGPSGIIVQSSQHVISITLSNKMFCEALFPSGREEKRMFVRECVRPSVRPENNLFLRRGSGGMDAAPVYRQFYPLIWNDQKVDRR